MEKSFTEKMINLLIVGISFLVLLSGVSNQCFSGLAVPDLILKIFVFLLAIAVWGCLLICIYMVRFVMPPIQNTISDGRRIVDSDVELHPKPNGELIAAIRKVDAVRLKMGSAIGECAEASQMLSEVIPKQAA